METSNLVYLTDVFHLQREAGENRGLQPSRVKGPLDPPNTAAKEQGVGEKKQTLKCPLTCAGLFNGFIGLRRYAGHLDPTSAPGCLP